MQNDLKVIVLAAGKGTRIRDGDSDAPKVMRQANGKPLLWYVLDALSFIDEKDILLIVGYRKEDVTGYFNSYAYAEQTEQLGTGHAVMSAGPAFAGFKGAVLVCYGDMPLVKRETYEAFIDTHFKQGNDCTIMTGRSDMQLSYGRVVRDGNGDFIHVVEERDCTPEELKITELNTGVYVFNSELLFDILKELKNDNSQGEYYLTDVPAIMRGTGAKIGLFCSDLGDEMIGVNTSEHLSMVEEILRLRTKV